MKDTILLLLFLTKIKQIFIEFFFNVLDSIIGFEDTVVNITHINSCDPVSNREHK